MFYHFVTETVTKPLEIRQIYDDKIPLVLTFHLFNY